MFLNKETPWRGAGVAIPMFSVRSEDDVGVGEFVDLKLVVDWAVDSGFHLLQLLPINDTSVHKMWWDSYPYRYEFYVMNISFYTKDFVSLFLCSYYYLIAMQLSVCICIASVIS